MMQEKKKNILMPEQLSLLELVSSETEYEKNSRLFHLCTVKCSTWMGSSITHKARLNRFARIEHSSIFVYDATEKEKTYCLQK